MRVGLLTSHDSPNLTSLYHVLRASAKIKDRWENAPLVSLDHSLVSRYSMFQFVLILGRTQTPV